MHEYGLARQVVRQAVQEAAAQGASRISVVHLRFGPEEQASIEALVFGIQAASKGTIAEGADVRVGNGRDAGIVLEALELEVLD